MHMKNKIYSLLCLLIIVACVRPIPRKPVLHKSASVIDSSVSFNKALIAQEENEFKALMKSDSSSNYLMSSNGFWYKYDFKSGNEYRPLPGDKIWYTLNVYDINNQLIYSEDDFGEQTYVIDQQEIVEGLRDGLKFMATDDIVTFLFPSHKVYGYLGDKNKIGINKPLIYKVKLNKINKKNESN